MYVYIYINIYIYIYIYNIPVTRIFIPITNIAMCIIGTLCGTKDSPCWFAPLYALHWGLLIGTMRSFICMFLHQTCAGTLCGLGTALAALHPCMCICTVLHFSAHCQWQHSHWQWHGSSMKIHWRIPWRMFRRLPLKKKKWSNNTETEKIDRAT